MFFVPVLSVVRSNRVPWLLGRRLAAAPVTGFHTKQIVVLEACTTTTACRSSQLGPCIVGARPVSTTAVNFQDLSYEDLEALRQGGDIQLIDVREPAEVAASGKIGNAINIPLGQVKDALLMSEDAFQNTYHAQKPQSYDHNIVFYGLGPIKSHAALKLAHKAGYTHAREYSAGWEDYKAKKGT
uniref:Fed tick salivary protein 7 n=1 Tax=Rhipicephalus appendiculatus TaxID=34631 RepID=A0A131Z0K9_RHIAP